MERDITIKKIENGYLVGRKAYNEMIDEVVCMSFTEAVALVANKFGEESFAATVAKSEQLTKALTAICELAIAPKLLAIEAKVNPGVENIVDAGSPADW